jgi:hypothetical protein
MINGNELNNKERMENLPWLAAGTPSNFTDKFEKSHFI